MTGLQVTPDRNCQNDHAKHWNSETRKPRTHLRSSVLHPVHDQRNIGHNVHNDDAKDSVRAQEATRHIGRGERGGDDAHNNAGHHEGDDRTGRCVKALRNARQLIGPETAASTSEDHPTRLRVGRHITRRHRREEYPRHEGRQGRDVALRRSMEWVGVGRERGHV